ncbi:hypothetical protein JCM19237_4992 [Photobacterium aphoticum]|uniref:HTH lysR-type domain-containing protein n=1 Tax=Photobacterium aphoticum TaxID=754436 RepID=A0A090QJW8_9GAMM|nr:hypothetical protein JCM19237_4992 [Photobacterium aphoticum]
MIEISRLLKYDMNLLICLYVLLQERNVKRTASKLYLSQSAVSKQLTKLRQVFDDPLFERQSKGLLPTPKALALEPKLEAILLHIDQLSAPEQFDPANSNRLFTFDLVETAYSMVFEHVFPTMLECAPHITIENRDWNEASIHRLQKGKWILVLAFLNGTNAPRPISKACRIPSVTPSCYKTPPPA